MLSLTFWGKAQALTGDLTASEVTARHPGLRTVALRVMTSWLVLIRNTYSVTGADSMLWYCELRSSWRQTTGIPLA